MTKNILLLLTTAAALTLTACSGDEETRYPAAKSEKVAWKVDVRSQTGESVNMDATDKEDWVDNVILAGSTYVATLTGKSYDAAAGGTNTAVFSVESFLGKKDFFFAANLNATDAERMGISGLEQDFNKLEFNTKDYLRGFFGNDAKKPIPMSAALRDVESPTNPVSGLTSLSKSEVKLERLFARIEVYPSAEMAGSVGTDHFAPYDFEITGIKVVNVPAKFSAGGAIANYDLKNAASSTDHEYLTLDLPAVGTGTKNSSTLKVTYPKMVFYLPEHYVSHPVFNSADANSMTCLEISYTAKWGTSPADIKEKAKERGCPEPQDGKCYFRIGDAKQGTTNYGQIRRNTVYQCTFTIGEKFGKHNPFFQRLNGRVIN